METLRVVMLGGRGVGKTSLLAGMYSHFDKLLGASNLRFDAELGTSERLQKRLEELQLWERDLGKTGGLRGDTELSRFYFRLGEKERRHSLRLEFVDYPGGWIIDRLRDVMGILKQSSVVLVAIDTPALMESTGHWIHLHDIENKPRLIKDIFVELYKHVHHPYLVLFVPLRCERYVQNAEEAKRLQLRIKEGYAEAFEFLQQKSHLSNLAVVITPVQTLGSVIFSRLVSRKDPQKDPTPPDDYLFLYEKVSPDARYAPVDTDQPLRYVLRFVLKEHLERRRRRGLFNVILGRPVHSLGLDTNEESTFSRILIALDGHYKLMQAIRPFAEYCKDTPPFQVIQGQSLLLKPL